MAIKKCPYTLLKALPGLDTKGSLVYSFCLRLLEEGNFSVEISGHVFFLSKFPFYFQNVLKVPFHSYKPYFTFTYLQKVFFTNEQNKYKQENITHQN